MWCNASRSTQSMRDHECSTCTGSVFSTTHVHSQCTSVSPTSRSARSHDCQNAAMPPRMPKLKYLEKSRSFSHLDTTPRPRVDADDVGQQFNLRIATVRDAFEQCVNHLRTGQPDFSSRICLGKAPQSQVLADGFQNSMNNDENLQDFQVTLRSLQQDVEQQQQQQQKIMCEFIDNMQTRLGSLESAVLTSLEVASNGEVLMNRHSTGFTKIGKVLESTLEKLGAPGSVSSCESKATIQLQLDVQRLESEVRIVADKLRNLESNICTLDDSEAVSQLCETIRGASHKKEEVHQAVANTNETSLCPALSIKNEKYEHRMVRDCDSSCIKTLRDSPKGEPHNLNERLNFKSPSPDMRTASPFKVDARLHELPHRHTLPSRGQPVPARNLSFGSLSCNARAPVVRARNPVSSSATERQSLRQMKRQPSTNSARGATPTLGTLAQGNTADQCSLQDTQNSLAHLNQDCFTV